MRFRSFIGTLFIVFGFLNILNFWAPRPIPTVGPSAFILGLLFMGTGFYLRAKRDASGKIEWGRLTALRGSGMETRKRNPRERMVAPDPLLAVRALRLAAAKDGRLTVAQTAMELNVPIDAAEAALDECVAKGTALIDVDNEGGLVSYRFPEFLRNGRE